MSFGKNIRDMVYQFHIDTLGSEICKLMKAQGSVQALSFDNDKDKEDMDIEEFMDICKEHPAKDMFDAKLRHLVRHAGQGVSLEDEYENKSSFNSGKQVFVNGEYVYTIALMILADDLVRHIDLWVNYPNEGLVPVEYVNIMVSETNSTETYLCSVSSYLPDSVSEQDIKNYFERTCYGYYICPDDEEFEEIEAYGDCSYYGYDNIVVADAHDNNFRAKNDVVYMIDYSEAILNV